MHVDMVTAYVRDLIERLTGERPEPDQDGDFVIQYEGAKYYFRVIGPNPIVQVFTVALAPVPATPELFGELNAINLRLLFARTFHVAEQVLIEAEIWGEDINPGNFARTCSNLASATDYFGGQLAERFGGQLRFEDEKSDDYNRERLSSGGSVGAYL